MDESVVVGIDIGTTKICTLVAREEAPGQLRILGVGIEPSEGIRKGTVVDLGAASQSVARSIDKAERSSGQHPRRDLPQRRADARARRPAGRPRH